MKTLVLLTCLIAQVTVILAQRETDKPITMTSTTVENLDLADVLKFQNIYFYKIQFQGAGLVGKDYTIVAKEIWDGEVKATDTIFNSRKRRVGKIQADSLNFKVIGSNTPDNKLKVMFFFPGFGIQKQYEATASTEYSFRSLYRGLAIEPGKRFYALAYILPYEADGYKTYCGVDDSGEDVESWGKVFRIPHYLIFEMNFF